MLLTILISCGNYWGLNRINKA